MTVSKTVENHSIFRWPNTREDFIVARNVCEASVSSNQAEQYRWAYVVNDDKKKMCHASSELKQYCIEFGTRILFHKMQKICHDVCTIETTGTLIYYYCKLYLHEYIHTHTQTYTHADWANHMHTTCIRMSCIRREKIMHTITTQLTIQKHFRIWCLSHIAENHRVNCTEAKRRSSIDQPPLHLPWAAMPTPPIYFPVFPSCHLTILLHKCWQW